MKVGELKEKLANIPDYLDIKLQIDQEGNGYEDVYGIDIALFKDDQVYNPDWTAVECGMGENEWKEFKLLGKKVALIYP